MVSSDFDHAHPRGHAGGGPALAEASARREGNGLAYRTALSEQNEDTWRFAHAHLSKLWVRLGLALAVVSAGAAYFGRSLLGTLFLWLIGGQMIFLCLSAFLVDGLLKANFNEDGSPAKKQ